MAAACLLLVLLEGSGCSGTLRGALVEHPSEFRFPRTDYLIDSYMFNSEEITSSIPASFDDYAVVDDLDQTCSIGTYFCWGVTTGSPPASLNLLIVEDSGGCPLGAPVVESCDTFIYDTGYIYADYTVWLAEMHLQVYVDHAWLGSWRNDGVPWYVCCGETVTGSQAYRTTSAGYSWEPLSWSIPEGDLFKVITDGWESPWWTSLNRITWGGIKGSF